MIRAVLIALITALAGFANATENVPTVAWDATRLTTTQYQQLDALALERQVVLRLMEEGFATVAPPTSATVTLRIEVRRERLQLEANGPAGQYRDSVRLDLRRPMELHLEIVHKAAELARAALGPRPAPAPAPAVAAPEPHEPGDNRLSRLGGALGGGVRWRSGKADVLARGGLRLALTASSSADLGVAFTHSSGTSIVVDEWEMLVGASLRWDIVGPVYASASALVGPLVHHFAIADKVAEPASGTRVLPMGALALSIGMRMWRSLGIEVAVIPSASRAVSHDLADNVLWHRPAFWIETVAFLSWRPD